LATTGQNFVLTGGTGTYLFGSTVTTAPFVANYTPVQALDAINAAPPTGSGVASGFTNNSAQSIDKVLFDLSLTTVPVPVGASILAFGSFVGGFALNGAIYITFTGTTGVTLDLTNAANSIGVTSSQAGDALANLLNALVIKNVSTVTSTITVAPGASNPVIFPNVLAGTTPTFALAPGDINCQFSKIGGTISSSHKTILFTPTAAGAIVVAWGGS
jgi:hypothetical protein